MREILLALLTCILLLPACNDEERLADDGPSAKSIFGKTGCKPKDIDAIRTYELYKDTLNHVRYLYGSKIYDNKESFWVSKFTDEGEYIWEIIHTTPDYFSQASLPALLSNGNIVIGNVLIDDAGDVRGISPVILAEEDGDADFIDLFDGFCYSEVHTFKNFFFCSISQSEANTFHTKEWAVQIKNNGKIMNQSTRMNIPTGKAIWPNDTTFVNMTPNKIEKGYLYKGQVWKYNIGLPDYESCEMEITLKDNIVNAAYHLTMADEETTTREYQLSYITGKEPIKVTGIRLEPQQQTLGIGDIFMLTATVTPADASVTDVTWTSSDKTVALVDTDGRVKAVGEGKCTVTATTLDGSFKATCQITVGGQEKVEGIYFEKTAINVLLNSQQQLYATIVPSTAMNKNIRWSSSSNRVVSVTPQGVITGKSLGTATITAETEDGGYTATCEVTVAEISDFITLTFSSSSVSIIDGYVTGSVYCRLTNNSPAMIRVTSLEIIDTYDGKVVGTVDPSLIGTLEPGQSFNLGSDHFQSIYYPAFKWEYEYEGTTYTIVDTYGKTTLASSSLSPRGFDRSPNASKSSSKQIRISHQK